MMEENWHLSIVLRVVQHFANAALFMPLTGNNLALSLSHPSSTLNYHRASKFFLSKYSYILTLAFRFVILFLFCFSFHTIYLPLISHLFPCFSNLLMFLYFFSFFCHLPFAIFAIFCHFLSFCLVVNLLDALFCREKKINFKVAYSL